MAADDPQLARSLFGYRPARVREILADRATMFRLAQGQAQQAQEKADRLQSELDAISTELDAMGAELDEQAANAEAKRVEAESQLVAVTESLGAQSQRADAAERLADALRADLEAARREVGVADERLDAARAQIDVLGTQVGVAESRASALQGELDAVRAELNERVRADDTEPSLATEELSVILDAAERGVSGIMERTKKAYEEQLAEAERERRAIRSEIERFGDWQADVEPRVRSIQESIAAARDRIALVPQQIHDAVGSMVEAIGTVSDSLDRLATLPGPLAPTERGPEHRDAAERRTTDVIRLREEHTEATSGSGGSSPEHGAPEGDDQRDADDGTVRAHDDPYPVTRWGH